MRPASRGLLHIVVSATVVFTAAAQTAPADQPLQISGTLIYNLLLVNAPPETSRRRVGARFAGRLAVRVAERTYLGVGVGSWSRATRAACTALGSCGEAVENWSEAIVYQAYAQHRPSPRWPVWVRAGLGGGNTSTLEPGGGVILFDEHWRVALSAGGGVDIRMTRHFFSTLSADFTILPQVDRKTQELRHAVSLGLGFTIR
jgi:hypothetical protein